MNNLLTKLTDLFTGKENTMDFLKQSKQLESALAEITGKHEATLADLGQTEEALKSATDLIASHEATIKDLTDKLNASTESISTLDTKVQELEDSKKSVSETAAATVASIGVSPISIKQEIKSDVNESIKEHYKSIANTSEGFAFFMKHKDVLNRK